MFKGLKNVSLVGLVIAGIWGFSTQRSLSSESQSSYKLTASWLGVTPNAELKSWTLSELEHLKKISSREKDPITSKVMKWEGILLSSLVDKALESLPVEGRAQVDLVVLKNASGASALIPRAFISKYPMLLALRWDSSGKEAGHDSRGPLYSVVPWTSKPKVLNEDLPLNNFFLSQISKIELTNYRDQYRTLYLKRRTDPSAMRGEKLFVQNCVSCHAMGQGPAVSGITKFETAKKFGESGHPIMKVMFKLTDRDRQSIIRYLDAHREENLVSVSQNTEAGRAPAKGKN